MTGEPLVHATAAIEEGACIGTGTRVWHHSHVRASDVIGAGCTLGKNVFIDEGVRIGDRVEDPEQRVGLPSRRARRRSFRRALGRVHERPAPAGRGRRLVRNQGMRDRYEYVMPGSNYRLTDLQAAIAAVQVARLPGINEARVRNAAKLSAGLPGLALPAEPPGRRHVWHQYTIRLDGRIGRDDLQRRLAARGIDSRPYYPRLVHDYACYHGHPQIVSDETSRAREAAGQVLSLHVHPALTGPDIDRIVSCVREALLEAP
jgi:DegT/DnrJ/EryC1/StrS aminotransferase family